MLCSVPVVWSFSASLIQRKAEAGTGSRATESHSHCSMSSHYIWDQNVTVVSMVRQLKDMVRNTKERYGIEDNLEAIKKTLHNIDDLLIIFDDNIKRLRRR